MNFDSPYWTKILDDFVSFCERYYPAFRESIVGASAEEIQEVEGIAGSEFPPEYRAFLRTMGNTPAHLAGRFLENSTYGIRAVRVLYDTPGLRPPRDAVYLWTYEFDAPYDIFIRTGGDERDLRPLVQIGWPVDPDSGSLLNEDPDEILKGGSLAQSLYQDAFISLRDAVLPHYAELRERFGRETSREFHSRRRAEFEAISQRLEFTPVPFMNEDLVFYNRSDASLKLYAQVGADVIYVRANEQRELARISEILSDNLEMATWG